MELVKILKAMSDETRIRILNLLKDEELCVCEIEYLLDLNQSNASRHLIKLTEANIITYYKRAKYVYYKLEDKILNQYMFIKELLDNELIKIDMCKEDIQKLGKYKNSGMSCDDLKRKCGCTEES